jgi:Uma2 family endonuclease
VGQLAERQRLLTRAEYERTVEAGLFRGEHVELIRGIIVQMSPQKAAHAVLVQVLTRMLVLGLGRRAEVRVQLPFAVGTHSLPEPDLAVVAAARFGDPHPDRAFLIIEVAETSLAEDRGDKAELYAEAGVPEYWIVNVSDRSIEAHSEPSRGAYTRQTPYRMGQRVAPAAFPDVFVDITELFTPSS